MWTFEYNITILWRFWMVQHCLHNETRVVMRKLVFYFLFFLFMHAFIDCYPLSIFLVVPLHTTDMLFLRINNLNFIDILLSLSFSMVTTSRIDECHSILARKIWPDLLPARCCYLDKWPRSWKSCSLGHTITII
jgi:hypothetical protein